MISISLTGQYSSKISVNISNHPPLHCAICEFRNQTLFTAIGGIFIAVSVETGVRHSFAGHLSSSLRHCISFAASPTLASRPHPLTWWVKLMSVHQVKQTIWHYLRGVSRVSKCIVGVSTIGAIKSERNNLSLPLGIQFIKVKVNGKLH